MFSSPKVKSVLNSPLIVTPESDSVVVVSTVVVVTVVVSYIFPHFYMINTISLGQRSPFVISTGLFCSTRWAGELSCQVRQHSLSE